MPDDEPFERFIQRALGHTSKLDPAAAHGFLTAAALCPGGYEDRLWQSGLFGEDPVNSELLHAAHECIAAIRAELLAGNYAPPARDEADCIRWSEGFRRMVAIADEAWAAFGEDYPEPFGALACIGLLADGEMYAELAPPGLSHREFVRENVPLLGSMVRRMAAYLLADDDMRAELDEGELLETWVEADLRELRDDDLLGILLEFEDRVPRVVIDECIRRGAASAARLRELLRQSDPGAGDVTGGRWWALLHAVFICGAIPGPEAGDALLGMLRDRRHMPDDDLWDWIAGFWPALFRNKREHAAIGLTEIVHDEEADPSARFDALECLVEAGQAAGPDSLDASLDEAARFMGDTAADDVLRELAGMLLLDFPRQRHRAALEAFAREQKRTRTWGRAFALEDVEHAFTRGADAPPWKRFTDFLAFYRPAAIRARQRRWRNEDSMPPLDTGWVSEPFMRASPKVGRNDPCPCGSGRKYKKCCMDKRP